MAQEGFKRKLSAILSADVEGYSRLMREDEEATIRTLKTYRTAIRNLIQRYRGRVVDSPGDNILAEFASVVDAVNCAVEIQRELAERNTELPDNRKMKFRVGVNLGDIVEDGERIYGDGVNIAARMESLAEGGGVCIAGIVYDQVQHKLGLEYEFLGEKEVKNIPEPVRAYRVLSYPGAAAHRVIKAKRAVGKTWRNVFLAIVAALVAVAAVAVWHFHFRSPPIEPAAVEKMAFPLPDKPSIAVLPFANLSDDPTQEYFSDGITEDLITDLSSISGLFVTARNSTFTYKGKPVKIGQVAEELGVRYVLEGSVRKAGSRVRINTQLIDATTGHHLWAQRYDGEMDDVFDLQDRITQKIVAALAMKLTGGEQENVIRKETDSIGAYDAFLQGRERYRAFTPDGFAKAIDYFKQAIELDPDYGLAYAALASIYWRSTSMVLLGGGRNWYKALGVSYLEARDHVLEYLKKAMQNPTPLAYQVSSEMKLHRYRGPEEAIADAERAIALDPNDPNGYCAMAYAFAHCGRGKEAVDFVKKAMRLDPHYPAYYLFLLGIAHFDMEQFKEAAALFERAIKRSSESCRWFHWLAAAYAHLGKEKEARAAFSRCGPNDIDNVRVQFYWGFVPYKNTEDLNRFLNGLRKAGMPEY